MAPRLSIVIVSWNTRDLLRQCLASLPAACDGLEHEVLVVDNDSRDGSDTLVEEEFPHCRLIRSGSNLGFSRGNNLAFGHCAGSYVLLLNPDTVCPPGSLATLLEFADTRADLGATTPRLVGADGRPTITGGFFPRARHHWLGFLDPLRLLPGRFLQERVNFIPAPGEPSHPLEYIAGACFLIPRPVLEEIGPLDERFFMYFEETDWCWRLRRAGRAVWYCADCEVVHLEGQAAGGVSDFSLRQFQKSYRLFLEKNYGAAVVPWYRLAQFLEYGLKGLLRSVVPANRALNGALGRGYLRRAALQLRSKVDAPPPPDSHRQAFRPKQKAQPASGVGPC